MKYLKSFNESFEVDSGENQMIIFTEKFLSYVNKIRSSSETGAKKIAQALDSLSRKFINSDFTNIKIVDSEIDEIDFIPTNRVETLFMVPIHNLIVCTTEKIPKTAPFYYTLGLNMWVDFTWDKFYQELEQDLGLRRDDIVGSDPIYSGNSDFARSYRRNIYSQKLKFYKKVTIKLGVADKEFYVFECVDPENVAQKKYCLATDAIPHLPEVLPKSQTIKIGRFISRLLTQNGIRFQPQDLESFVNEFKSKRSQELNLMECFELVSGEETRKWYLGDNYIEDAGGSLKSSCMRYPRCQEYFDIYTENPEVCKLLILKEGDKISGRALVWELIYDGTYMDRVYYSEDFIRNIFHEYAKKNGWLTQNDLTEDKEITKAVQLKEWDFEYYPFLDTFYLLDMNQGIIHSQRYIFDSDRVLDSDSGEWGND